MAQTITEKVVQAHAEDLDPGYEVQAGDMVTVRPFHVMTHDNTGAVLPKFRTIGASRVADPSQPVFTLDHNVQDTSEANLAKYAAIETFAREQGIVFHPAGAGIGHQLMCENGFVHPGSLVVASDSHANTYGATGALGTPVVRTDAAAIWATGEFWWQIPRTVQVVLEGALRPGVSGKDLILTLCARFDGGEVLNAAVEFAGPGVASLDMAARMTVANMTTEWGALVGWFPVDRRTLAYLTERKARLEAAAHPDRIRDEDLFAWSAAPPGPDSDADYAARITVDLARIEPFLAGPDAVQVGQPVAVAARSSIPIQKAYLLSCVNGRLEDLEAAAEVARGNRVADGVELYVAAASREIQDKAEANGTWATLLDAGAIPLEPGCGPCIGLGAGLLEPGEVGISATNRNFKGRMGSRDARVYLASPAVVAASALAGRITDAAAVRPGPAAEPGVAPATFRVLDPAPPGDEAVDILDGFPERVTGRLVFVTRDNLNTDGIYGKEHTYRDRTPGEMATVVMANYDPDFAERTRPGDILVGARNFGTGSSREQAATALQARGIALVIAASLSQTYQRNAFNNGFVCLECPSLVEHLEAELADAVAAGEPTVIPGDALEIDFGRSVAVWRGRSHRFPPLGRVPQALVVAGGAERQVQERLGVGQPA